MVSCVRGYFDACAWGYWCLLCCLLDYLLDFKVLGCFDVALSLICFFTVLMLFDVLDFLLICAVLWIVVWNCLIVVDLYLNSLSGVLLIL